MGEVGKADPLSYRSSVVTRQPASCATSSHSRRCLMRVRSIVVGVIAVASLPAMAFGQLGFTGIFRSGYGDFGGMNPTGIPVGDYDCDGAVDVVTTTAGVGGNDLNRFPGVKVCVAGANAGFICTNNGDCPGSMCRPDGTIGIPNSLPLNSFPSTLLQANFDGDQFDDLIVAKADDNAVAFLKGRGDAEFFDPPGPPITVGQSPVGLASADIDGDGKRDLVVANEGSEGVPGSVSVLKGQGNGTFILQQQPNPDPEEPPLQGATAELGTRAVAGGNTDANPGLEALAVNRRSDSVSVFTIDQDCILTLSANLPAGAEPSDLALADLNNDGKLDLIVVNTNDDAVTVQFGNGDRTFGTAQSYPVGPAPARLVVGQLNNDTLLHLAVANSRSGNVSIL